jgi:hypothetical protein
VNDNHETLFKSKFTADPHLDSEGFVSVGEDGSAEQTKERSGLREDRCGANQFSSGSTPVNLET